MNRSDFLSIARSWLGTPWKHQGRRKGQGVDCVGFVAEVARESGLADVQEAANYQRRPDSNVLRHKLGEYLTPIRTDELRPADVVLMAFGGVETHIAIVGGYPVPGELSLIHAYLTARKVIEHRLDDQWRAKIVAAYRIPEFAEVEA